MNRRLLGCLSLVSAALLLTAGHAGIWPDLGTLRQWPASTRLPLSATEGRALTGAASSAAGSEIVLHVSPEGSDSYPGTEAEPFQSIPRARDAVRSLLADGVKADITVMIRGGRYFLPAPLSFDDRDSAPEGHVVSYRNHPGEEPIIVGGRPITQWERYFESIYRAYVGPEWRFYTLFENGVRATMARLPNEGYARVEGAIPDANRTRFVFAAGELPGNMSHADAQVYIWAGHDWSPDIVPVATIDWSTRTITLSEETNYPIKTVDRYFLQGSGDLLDKPGEFYLSESDGYLYYWPRSEPIESQDILAPTTPRIIQVRGRSSAAIARGLRFEGLTLTVSDFVKSGTVWSTGANAAIYLENAEDVAIRFCRIRDLGGSGVALRNHAQKNLIYGNLIENLGVHGVWLNGLAIGRPHVNRDNRVSNNRIRRGGQLHGVGSGIMVGLSGDNELSHNKITDMPRYGISLKGLRYGMMAPSYEGVDVTWENHWDFIKTRNNVIQFNDISRVLTDSEDAGGIEAWGAGRGNRIENNRVHDFTTGVPNGLAFGIYIDDASDFFTIRNNIVYGITGARSSPAYIKGIYNEFSNNVVVNDGSRGHVWAWAYVGERNDHLTFARNIFYSSSASEVYGFMDWTSDKIAEANQNLFYHTSGRYEVEFGFGRDRITLDEWRTRYGFDRDSVVADPLFADPAGRDHRVRDGSPALALGFANIDQSRIGLLPDFPYDRD